MSRTNKGQTPLHIAVEMAESQWLNRDYNYGLTIKLLLGAGALVDAGDSIGTTALQVGYQVVGWCLAAACVHSIGLYGIQSCQIFAAEWAALHGQQADGLCKCVSSSEPAVCLLHGGSCLAC